MKWTKANEIKDRIGTFCTCYARFRKDEIYSSGYFIKEAFVLHYLNIRIEKEDFDHLEILDEEAKAFTEEEVIELLAKFSDYIIPKWDKKEWHEPNFKGNIQIASEWLNNFKLITQ